jgi:predicted membrane protein
MMFELVQLGFRVSDNVMDFTVFDHLKLLMFWAIGITVVHYVLFTVRKVIKLVAKPIWWVLTYLVEAVGMVYFNIVGAIGCLYYVVCMIPLLLFASFMQLVVLPICWFVTAIFKRCDDILEVLMGYSGMIPKTIGNFLHTWVVMPMMKQIEQPSGSSGRQYL